MSFLRNLFWGLPRQKNFLASDSLVIDIPSEIYYKELAIYTAVSLISNAISRSEIKVFENGEAMKNEDYYLLNISPNANETSSMFWHRVINKIVYEGKALVVEAGGKLYCADSFIVDSERPILGDIYSNVTVGNFTFDKKFTVKNSYLLKLDNMKVRELIDGLYSDYGKLLTSASKDFKRGCGKKYKLHIDSIKAGDEDFNTEFENHISKQLKSYMENDNSVYPEFDGYTLTRDDNNTSDSSKKSSDIIDLKSDLFKTVAHAFHIPDSMMDGNMTNISDVIKSFLSFGVDPYADMISEALNKRGGAKNYLSGNFYQIDTGKISHRDIFDVADGIASVFSSGVLSIDEIREEMGYSPLNTDYSVKHYITKNFAEAETVTNELE